EKQTWAVVFLIHNRVFRADMLYLRVENTVGAQSAQWLITDPDRSGQILRAAVITLARTAARPRGSPLVRGGEACPRTSGDHVEKQAWAVVVLIHNRVFRADMLYLRVENTVGARSAQWPITASG
ncbi:MAG: hypothetical protein WC830_15190, partial [Burkholderiales bacterium]